MSGSLDAEEQVPQHNSHVSNLLHILSNGKYKNMDDKCHYLNGSRNRDISFFSSSFAGGLTASNIVSAIMSSLSTSASRREALSEVV